jgi:adenylosuccinate synthase
VHTFFHIPSAVLHSNAKVYITSEMLLNEKKLADEIAKLEARVGASALRKQLFINPRAIIITPADMEEESNLMRRIGSTAQGVGVVTAKRIMREILPRIESTEYQIIRPYVRELDVVGGVRLLEGTQGFGLSLFHSHYPYCTSRDTGVCGLMSEAGVNPSVMGRVYGIFRTYPIRVQSPKDGTSGYMFQELSWEEIHMRSGVPMDDLKVIETTSTTKRERRVGEWDEYLFHKSCAMNDVSNVVITFADYYGMENRKATKYEELSDNFRAMFGKYRPCLISTGFGDSHLIDLRDEANFVY